MLLKTREKKERALGTKLFLKGERCYGPKCAMVRRPYKPGMHGKGKRRRALSEYGQQLLEKQRIKVSYGLNETQMRNIFKAAKTGLIGKTIASGLERRLANVVFRLGFAPSRTAARQLVNHGHILVNSKKTTSPSFLVKIGDVISINPSSKEDLIFKDLPNTIKKYQPPGWLIIDEGKLEGKIKSFPGSEELPFDINLVVDYYSR